MKKRVAIFITAFSLIAVFVILSVILIAYFYEWGVFDRGDGFKEETQRTLTEEEYKNYIDAMHNRIYRDLGDKSFFQIQQQNPSSTVSLRFFDSRYEKKVTTEATERIDYFSYLTGDERYHYYIDGDAASGGYVRYPVPITTFHTETRMPEYRTFLSKLKDRYADLEFDETAKIYRVKKENEANFLHLSGLELLFNGILSDITVEFNKGKIYRIKAQCDEDGVKSPVSLTFTMRTGKGYEVKLPQI